MDSDIQQSDGNIEEHLAADMGAVDSVLDRGLALPLTAAAGISALALLVASLLRLPELARWAMSPEEGALALAARDLVRGVTIPDNMFGRPVVVEWVALSMFLGDTNESIARVGMAIAGIIAIAAVLALRPLIGGLPAALAALFLALSPTFVTASRAIDGGALTIALSILLFASLPRALRSDGLVYPILSGVALALLILSGPLGLPAVVLTLIGVYLTLDELPTPSQSQLLAALAGFVPTFLLLSSALLTQPSSIYKAPLESLTILWDDHIANVGDGLPLVLWNLVTNEPLLLVLAIAALLWRRDTALVRGLGAWAVVSLVLIALLGNSGAEGFGLAVLPIALLAGIGAAEVVEHLHGSQGKLIWALGFAGSLLVLVFAFLSLAGLARPVAGRSTSETVVRFLLVAIVVLIPTGILLVRAAERLSGQRIALVLTAAVILLGSITLRSAVLSVTEWPGEPGNLLTSRPMGDDIPVVVDRIQRISRDLTRTERDARMPVGGIGLHIALDERIEQPFAWYFRDYPNLSVFDPASSTLPEGTQLAILAGSRDPAVVTPGLSGSTYVLQYDDPGYIADPNWANMASDFFSLEGWRHFFSFVLNRETSQPVPASEFQLQAIPTIAERFAISTGPYSLDERAGIGSAGGQFNQPRGIALDSYGGIYVVDGGNTRLQHFDATGTFDQTLADGSLAPFPSGAGGAGGIAINAEGNLYVADTWNHQIKVFAPSGEQLRAWGSFFDAMDDAELVTTNPGQFYGPRSVAIHDDLLYVTDTGNERVQVFTLDGEFVRMFGAFGSGQGQLIEPVGIAIADDGTVLVADSHNARIARFTPEGEPLEAWPVDLWAGQQFFEPYLAVGPDGRVYASDSASGLIAVFDASGTPLASINDPSLLRPYGMAITPDGLQMLVTDGLANAVIRIGLVPAE